MNNILPAVILLPLIFLSNETHSNSDVNFHGTLYKVTCRINNDAPVDIQFGNVGINKIDGVLYTQSVPLKITCDEAYSGNLSFTITGTMASFDRSAIQSDIAGLGIRIMQDGKPVTIGQSFSISATSPPALTAVPVAQTGSTLNEGLFHATATFVAEVD